jgi:ParB family chromosome partitioning protein
MSDNALAPISAVNVSRIRVLNPRTRSKRQRQTLQESIAAVGLKKPITITPRSSQEDTFEFDLVCGQGRLEAVQALGHSSIPANIIDRPEDECLVMSLVENIADAITQRLSC